MWSMRQLQTSNHIMYAPGNHVALDWKIRFFQMRLDKIGSPDNGFQSELQWGG
jgi:hypothetical protein